MGKFLNYVGVALVAGVLGTDFGTHLSDYARKPIVAEIVVPADKSNPYIIITDRNGLEKVLFRTESGIYESPEEIERRAMDEPNFMKVNNKNYSEANYKKALGSAKKERLIFEQREEEILSGRQ